MLTDCFAALSHPVRLQLLKILATQSECICGDVIHIGSFSEATVLTHLRSLKRVGLIQGEVDGPNRCYWLDLNTLETFKRLVASL